MSPRNQTRGRLGRPALVGGLFASAALLSTVLAQPRPGGPGASAAPAAPAPPPVTITSFAATPQHWVWLSPSGQHVTLVQAEVGGRGKTRASGSGWNEVAAAGDRAWILAADRLLEVTLTGGESPRMAVTSLATPGGLYADGENLYWLELVRGAPGSTAIVPITGPTIRLRARSGDGALKTLGSWPASPEPYTRPGSRDVFGVTADHVYARIKRFAATEFVRFPRASGQPERLAIESGVQEGVLHQGRLYWTAPSEEVAEGNYIRSVRYYTTENQVRTLTDWLPGGVLLSSGDSAWYAGEFLYRLPKRFGPSEPLQTLRDSNPVLSGMSLISPNVFGGPRVMAELR